MGKALRMASAPSGVVLRKASRWTSSPSNLKTVLKVASQSRSEFSAIVSNTGWTSVCELLMTRRISAVAVCCSSVSVRSLLRASSSLNRRTFSMAITAWLAKVCSRAICCSPKPSGSAQPIVMAPIGSPARSMGTVTWLRVPRASIICRDSSGTPSARSMSVT